MFEYQDKQLTHEQVTELREKIKRGDESSVREFFFYSVFRAIDKNKEIPKEEKDKIKSEIYRKIKIEIV